jgi:Na+-translocating ferredoxin:NAD+ oxidoreductase RnfE subunit
MNENLHKSVFLTAPAITLGIGLVAPLMADAPLKVNLYLGGASLLSLTVITFIIALFTGRLPHNNRTGIAIVLAGGAVSAGTVIGSLFFGETHLPVETLAPLLISTALIALHTEAYSVNKPLQPALIDALGIGTVFMLLLIGCGFIGDLVRQPLFHLETIAEILRFFHTMPGIFLLAGLAAAFMAFLTKPRKRRQQ